MVKFIKKRVYNLDKSYKYFYYQVVNNKKKRISSKKYHTYLKKIAKKNANILPMILLKKNVEKYLPVSEQVGGDGEASNDFGDLLEKIKKYKNNPNLKLGKTYVIDHNLVQGEKGEMQISMQNEKQLKELLKYADLLFDTQYIHLKDSNGKLKKYAILIPNKIDGSEISKHINYYLNKETYNTFSFNENKPEITDKMINNYLTITNPNTGSPENLDTIVNKQFEQSQIKNGGFSKYLSLLNKMSKNFEMILSNLLSQTSSFNDKNVQSLINQVILALISNSQIDPKNEEQASFYYNKDLVDYNITYFEGNIAKYNNLLGDNSKDGLLNTYGNFPKIIRKALNDTYQFDSKYFIPIKIMEMQSIDIFSWNNYFSKYNQYREEINKSLIENDYESQCAAVKSYHQYFKSINEKMNKNKRKFQGKNATFLFSPSRKCQTLNDETDLNNSSQTYDMIKGFKENDNIQLESVVSVIKNLLLMELTITELSSLQKISTIIDKTLIDLSKQHKSDEINITTNVENFLKKTTNYKTSINDKNLSIFARISKLKEYKIYLEEAQSKNLKFDENISNKYKQMNFKNNLTDDAIQKLTQISNTLPKIDTNLLKEFINEYKIPIVSSTNDSNSEIKSQQAINEIYTLFEFFSNFYKKLDKSEEETCDNISVYNLSKLQKCITESENNFYPRDEKVDQDLALFEEQYKDAVLKQTKDIRIGYPGIKQMFDNYKHIHPFFENQLSISISKFNDNLDKLELEKQQKLEEERRKQEELNKKKEIENEANKLKELARKAINDEQEAQERKQAINNQIIQNEKNLNNLQTGGGDKLAVGLGTAASGALGAASLSANSMDIGNTLNERHFGLDKIYLEKDKHKNLEYIYLINQGCAAFEKKSLIWSNNPRKKINLMFENDDANITFTQKFKTSFGMNVKSVMETLHPNDDYSTTTLNKEGDYKDIMKLEKCSEYRLRSINKDDVQYISMFTRNMKKYIQKSRSVWTIQKNIYMTPTDKESYNRYEKDFETKWIDLSIIKDKYPDKLSSLDDMLLDKQAHKRRRALESLIKYATYGNKIDN
tara:strand:- start:9273 stop:12455 length:3183 start_codon:yes stop_codon:yes gene_type:complete